MPCAKLRPNPIIIFHARATYISTRFGLWAHSLFAKRVTMHEHNRHYTQLVRQAKSCHSMLAYQRVKTARWMCIYFIHNDPWWTGKITAWPHFEFAGINMVKSRLNINLNSPKSKWWNCSDFSFISPKISVFNSLWPGNAIGWIGTLLSLFHAMACCLFGTKSFINSLVQNQIW